MTLLKLSCFRKGATPIKGGVYTSAETGPNVLQYLACKGDEATIDHCPYLIPKTKEVIDNTNAGVSCEGKHAHTHTDRQTDRLLVERPQ